MVKLQHASMLVISTLFVNWINEKWKTYQK